MDGSKAVSFSGERTHLKYANTEPANDSVATFNGRPVHGPEPGIISATPAYGGSPEQGVLAEAATSPPAERRISTLPVDPGYLTLAGTDNLQFWPEELSTHILSHLGYNQLLLARRVCEGWKNCTDAIVHRTFFTRHPLPVSFQKVHQESLPQGVSSDRILRAVYTKRQEVIEANLLSVSCAKVLPMIPDSKFEGLRSFSTQVSDQGNCHYYHKWVDNKWSYYLAQYQPDNDQWVIYEQKMMDNSAEPSYPQFVSDSGRIAFCTNSKGFEGFIITPAGYFRQQFSISRPESVGKGNYQCCLERDIVLVDHNHHQFELFQYVAGQGLVSRLQEFLPTRFGMYNCRLSPYGNLLLIEDASGSGWNVFAPDRSGAWSRTGYIVQKRPDLSHVNFSADGKYLLVYKTLTPVVQVFRLTADSQIEDLTPACLKSASVYGASFSPNGCYMAVGIQGDLYRSGHVQFFQLAGDHHWLKAGMIPVKESGTDKIRFTFSPDGNIALIYSTGNPSTSSVCRIVGLNHQKVWVEKGGFNIKKIIGSVGAIHNIQISPCNSLIKVIPDTDRSDCPQMILQLTPDNQAEKAE